MIHAGENKSYLHNSEASYLSRKSPCVRMNGSFRIGTIFYIFISFVTGTGSPQHRIRTPITVDYPITQPVNFPCGRKLEQPEET